MATTTTNFGWDIPQSTDLVKDGATAIAALGQDIDTAFVDLKGGTTGQVLAKASGTDLDFSWVAQDDSNAIQNAIVDAKGDLIAATAADTPARLAVGTDGQVLTADSTAATGLKWGTAAATSGPAFRAYRSGSNQTVTADVATKVQLNSESYDTDGCFDNSTNYRFTPTKAGYYQLNANIQLNIGNDNGVWVWFIYKNGSSYAQGEGSTGALSRETGSGSDLIYFNGSTDYVEMYGYAGSGSSTYFTLGESRTFFSGTWIRS